MSEDEHITDEEIEEALELIGSGEADLADVLLLVDASFERDEPIAAEPLIAAVVAKYETDGDFANGGADQFVWNNGAELARNFGSAWRTVGAVENGDLLHHLADELERYSAEVGEHALTEDPVTHFLTYRRRVKGPSFGIPEPDEELAEALLEWAIEHARSES